MSSGLTFTQGLLVGQLSVVLLIGAFIRFFIFGEAPSRSSSGAPRTSKHIRTTSFHSLSPRSTPTSSLRKKPSQSNVLRAVPTSASDTESILRKTYYHIPSKSRTNHNTHQPESLDWFNVLIAQTIAQYRQTAYNLKDSSPDRPGIIASLSAAINDESKRPSFIGDINITEISLGEEYPIFSNVRVAALEDDSAMGGRLQALVDVDMSDDNLTLGIESCLILNYPKPRSAVLPVALTVSLVRFSGTLSISFVPANDDALASKDSKEKSEPMTGKPKTNLAFSFLPDYRLDLSVRSLIGSRSRLQDVPKVAQLVESRIQAWFEERVVEPRVQVVPLPGMWPRMGKTHVREGQEDDRPISKDGDRLTSNSSVKERRKSDHFPTQEEAEALIAGLRKRAPQYRRTSEAIATDEEPKLPGSLPV